MSNDWDMDLDDDFNQDLLGRPFDMSNALDAMMFPVSPLSKAGQRTLKYAQRSLQHEYEKKKNRRRTLDIFLEQFDNRDTPGESLLDVDDEDEKILDQAPSSKKPRFSSFKSTMYPKRQSPTFLRMPQLPASRLVLPTKLKTPARITLKRSRPDEAKAPATKRFQPTITRSLPTVPTVSSLKSPGKSRIPVRQVV
ncbi:hypothetical protein AC1031_015597 [Aphanomyces cochlioides]|nr:hypothetical protein AC1031_015597 [Aphanomyces cochlioides]